MSWMSDASKALSVASWGLHALESIGPMILGVIGDKSSSISQGSLEQLSAITLAIDAIRAGMEGKVSIDAVEDEIKQLQASRKANGDATQSEIDKKFPT